MADISSNENVGGAKGRSLRLVSGSSTVSVAGSEKSQEKGQHIQVAVRVRPLNDGEKKQNTCNVVTVNPGKREVTIREKINALTTKTFVYDKVFGPNSEQIDVYREVVVPSLQEVLMGYNCTIFAYGQTGTGKTFTMEGERTHDQGGLATWESDPLAGIIPRTLHQLFETLATQQADFTIRVSFIELYNEELFDLLGADNAPSLRLYDDPVRKGSVVIQGLEEVIVRSKEEVYKILDHGAKKRATAATLLNAHSSRSHSVFSITVHIRETAVDGEEMLKTGKMYLVDLAGSENIGRSGAVDKRAKEAGQINQSLLTLGRVITALVEHARHIPYRESKLTRLLQDSLGGRTKTSIIATISPSSNCIEETLSTLDYAFRAKNITNKPEINQKVTKKALLKEYAEEIERLRRDLQATREKQGVFMALENYDGIMQKMTNQEDHIRALEEKLALVNQESGKMLGLFAKSKEELNETMAQLEKTVVKLGKARTKLVATKSELLDAVKVRDETQFLLKEHEEKENISQVQYRELVSLNEKSMQNIQLLHGKLDRTKIVQSANERQLDEFRGRIVAQVDEMKESLNSFSAVQQEIGGEQIRQAGSLVQDAVQKCQTVKESVTKLTETFEAKMMQLTAQMESQMMEHMQMLKAHMMENTQLLKAVKDDYYAQEQRILSALDEMCSSVKDGVQTIISTQEKCQEAVSRHEDNENEKLDSFRDSTNEFVDHHFAKDVPTGNTPLRPIGQNRIPKDLTRVGPREPLLQRFREQYVAPELESDTSILED